jgi:hypothetical protein
MGEERCRASLRAATIVRDVEAGTEESVSGMKTPPTAVPPPALAPTMLAVLVRLSKEPLLRYRVPPAMAKRLVRDGLIELIHRRITERGTAQRREHWQITDKGGRTLVVCNARVAADAIDALVRQGTAEAREHAARALQRLPASPPLRYPIPPGIRPPDLGELVALVVAGGLDSARALTFAAELRAWAGAIEASS